MKRPSFINFFLVVLSMRDSLLLLFSYFEFNSHSSGKVEPAEKRKERRGLKKKKTTLFFFKYCHRVVRVGLEKRKETTRAISSVFSLPHAPGARALTTRACENGMVVDRQIRFFFSSRWSFFLGLFCLWQCFELSKCDDDEGVATSFLFRFSSVITVFVNCTPSALTI